MRLKKAVLAIDANAANFTFSLAVDVLYLIKAVVLGGVAVGEWTCYASMVNVNVKAVLS